MANREQLSLIREALREGDISIWNKWREQFPFRRINLSKTNLNHANLAGANLARANLTATKMIGADFSGAQLNLADFRGAHLLDANFQNANMILADLRYIDLSGVNFSGTNLIGTSFDYSKLERTNFGDAQIGGISIWGSKWIVPKQTTFIGVDLSSTLGLSSVKHQGRTAIDIDTIFKSQGNISSKFLGDCGFPEVLITFAQSFVGKEIAYYSCFISHSAKDKQFCERLYADLRVKGISVFYFPEDAKWGETVWGEIDRSIKVYDKLVVVLSENSLASGPVNREIERALNREDAEHKSVLFPITLDRYVFDTWGHERKADVLAKVVGDFSGWDKDATKYDKAFDKLLKGLQAESGK